MFPRNLHFTEFMRPTVVVYDYGVTIDLNIEFS